MRRLLILSICVSLITIVPSCGMNVEQQAATNENGFTMAEQVVQEEYKSENTIEKVAKADDVMSSNSKNIATESTNVAVDVITSNKSLASNSKSDQDVTTSKSNASTNTLNTESKNTVSKNQNTDMPKSNSAVPESYEQRMKAEYDAVVENAITNQSYNDVLKSTVSDDIIIWYLDYTMNPWQSVADSPVSINGRYKIELIRAIDDKRMYSIQKPESGGLFYSFYVNSGLQCTAYITKSLSFADYNAIKVGSSINDVIEIEPATQAYIKRNKTFDDLNNDGELADKFMQHIILKDGLLKLTYSRNGDTYKVNQIDFFDNFKESVDWGMNYPFVYDYGILPEDFPS